MQTDRIFNGIPAANIDAFFSFMNISDQFLPHTRNRISPITFSNFMTRNNIMCLNQLQVYEAANMNWRIQLRGMPNVLEEVHKHAGTDYSLSEEPHPGWCPLIDYLNRVMDIEKIDSSYAQMHYLAHVLYLSSQATMSEDKTEDVYIKALFHDCISPVLYPMIIPTVTAFFAPVKMFSDPSFSESVTNALIKINTFIASHCGRTTDTKVVDETRLTAIHELVREALETVHKNKYDNGVWQSGLGLLLNKLMMLKTDLKICEYAPIMERDGCKSFKALRSISKIKRAFDNDHMGDDPEMAIDMLLDTYADVKKYMSSYNMSTDQPKVTKQGVNNHE